MLASVSRTASRASCLASQLGALGAPLRSTLAPVMPTQSSATPARSVSLETRKRLVRTTKHVATAIPAPVVPAKVAVEADESVVKYQHPMPVFFDPAHPTLAITNNELFAVVQINQKQFKVAKGDLVMANHIKGVVVGDQLAINQVLLVGARDFTVIGQPMVENASVLVTVEEQTHLQPRNIFHMRRRTGFKDLKRFADLITVLRVDSITYDSVPAIASRAADQLAPAHVMAAKKNSVQVQFNGNRKPATLVA